MVGVAQCPVKFARDSVVRLSQCSLGGVDSVGQYETEKTWLPAEAVARVYADDYGARALIVGAWTQTAFALVESLYVQGGGIFIFGCWPETGGGRFAESQDRWAALRLAGALFREEMGATWITYWLQRMVLG
ncbi:hypothetical protein CYMTET_21728 [Cymbomonas tetramitiformis]|uniref:Uncharacterized protein n=1 Tax=Cymbomonas tetramitiformis TaxID=36881 RepID=A0AAE0G1K0_9CHLO|nr:hypothetical protein CYMTET_21728 [Cymbomonas tetramitiformis]